MSRHELNRGKERVSPVNQLNSDVTTKTSADPYPAVLKTSLLQAWPALAAMVPAAEY